MSATKITVVGNVVNSPSRVRLQNGSVTNFRMAANERWFDSATQAFVDGASFSVWRATLGLAPAPALVAENALWPRWLYQKQ